jgi:hypothetical protein
MTRSRMSAEDRLSEARRHFGKDTFSRKDYLLRFSGLSPATASRDLQKATEEKVSVRKGDKATARYRFR